VRQKTNFFLVRKEEKEGEIFARVIVGAKSRGNGGQGESAKGRGRLLQKREETRIVLLRGKAEEKRIVTDVSLALQLLKKGQPKEAWGGERRWEGEKSCPRKGRQIFASSSWKWRGGEWGGYILGKKYV